MQRVALLGPESCGKSTLGRYLAKRYPFVTYIPEYARTWLEQRLVNRSDEQEEIAVKYADIEHMARHTLELIQRPGSACGEYGQEEEVILYDTELIYYRIWFDHAFGHHPTWLDRAICEFPMDNYLLFYPDLPWVADPTRENGSDSIRHTLYEEYKKAVEDLSIPYYIIRHC